MKKRQDDDKAHKEKRKDPILVDMATCTCGLGRVVKDFQSALGAASVHRLLHRRGE